LYSLRKVLLTEEIISQRSFVSRLIDLVKKKPNIIGAFNFGSYEKALEFVTDIEEDEERSIEIDGLRLTSEEVKSYEEMKKEFREKEDKRLKTLTIKKSKGIKTTERDETPISFNAGIFFKRSKEEKLLSFQERSICLEIIKVDSILGLSSIKDKKTASKVEAIMTRQISKFLNVDETPVNFKAIMPLYDKMLEYIEKRSDVTVDSCIKAADLYIKELYATATPSERQKIDGGNFDFSLVFSRSNYFAKYSKAFSGDTSPIIDLYEDEDVKIVYPTSVEAFNKEISSNKIENGLSWCTQGLGSWQSHHKDHFVAILYDKSITDDSDPNFIISLKINYHVDDPYDLIDFEATCDRNNFNMDEESVSSVINKDVIESLTLAVSKKLKYFEPEYVRKNLNEIPETLEGLVRSGRIDIAKEVISKSLAFSPSSSKTVNLVRGCLSNTNDESERLLLKVIFEIAADSIFYGEYFNVGMSKKIFDYDFIYEGVVTNLNASEFYNILFSLIQNPRAHPKHLIAILKSLDKETIKMFLSTEEIINACKIAFNTNSANSFKLVGNEVVYSQNGILEIINNENKIKEFFDIIVSSRGFKRRLTSEYEVVFHKILLREIKDTRKREESSQTSVVDFGFGSIDQFLLVMIIKHKESCLEVLEKNNLLDIVKKVDQALMKEYIEFSIQNSRKGILSLLDESEVRADLTYTKQFDGIILSKEDFENTMLKILRDKEVLKEACNSDDSLYQILLNKSFMSLGFSAPDDSLKDKKLDVVKFLLESNIEMSSDVISICTREFDKIYRAYKKIENVPEGLLNGIIGNVKEGIRSSGGAHRSILDLIEKSCFYSLEKREVDFLKMTSKLINLIDSDNEVADSMFNLASRIGGWGEINVDIIRHNYMNFLFHMSDQLRNILSKKVNDLCGKSLDTSKRLDHLDIDRLKSARIIVMKGTKRYLNIEQEVYDNIVHNTKRPMSQKEILLNLHILGSENINIAKSFDKNKVKDIFESYTKDIKLVSSGRVSNSLFLQQALELCIEVFVNLANHENMNINRFYTRELIEEISEHYQVLVTNYDNKEQKNLDKLIIALIENYMSFNREGEVVGDAFASIKSILEKASKNSSHIFYDQKFSPVVRNAIENIPKDISGSNGNYYQEISKLFNMQDEASAGDNTTDAEVQSESALRNYIRMLLS